MNNPLILALDFSSIKEAHNLLKQAQDHIGMIKIGLELYTKYGNTALELGKIFNLPIFLDLKLHDIPNTVAKSVANVAELSEKYDIQLLTVHSLAGSETIKSSLTAAKGSKLNIAFVSILTSFSQNDLLEIGIEKDLLFQTLQLSLLANRFGASYFICSPMEIVEMKRYLGKHIKLIVPRIRLESSDKNDQFRTSTPKYAIKQGADKIVLGRSITQSKNPVETLLQIKRDIGLC